MDARICPNPACRTIQPGHECGLCKKRTSPLPKISLAPIGIDGTAHLVHRCAHGYAVQITTQSTLHRVAIPLSNLLQSAQPHLSLVNEAGGLMIMDTLKSAARLIRSKNTGHWAGWILYLLEALQDRADATAFQEVLTDLSHDLDNMIVEDDIPPRLT